jgi:integrase
VKIGDLTRAQIKRWHSSLKHKPYDGNRALAYLRKALALAHREWELRADNPASGVKMFEEKRRERFFSDAELARIGETLAALEAESGHVPGCFTAVRLLALTGMRLGEVLGLRWEYIDSAEACARLPDAKAGARTVPLGASVLAFLSGLHCSGEYVCEAVDPTKPLHLKTFRRFWKKLNDQAGLANARPHDFRHTAGTYVAQGGANAFTVRDILGHKTMAMTGRYVAKSIDPLRAATDQFSSRVAAAMEGRPSAEIVPLKKAR